MESKRIQVQPIEDLLAELNALDVEVWIEEREGRDENDTEFRLRCNAPKGVLTSTLKQRLSARKSEIVAHLQQLPAGGSPTTGLSALPPIQPVPRTQPLVLSFAQQRLWFLERLEGIHADYNMPGMFWLEGELNRVALERSLEAIVRRHESLRTTFRSDRDGIPYQYVNEAETVTLPAIEVPDGDRVRFDNLVRSEARQPFDLTCDWPIRFKVLQLSPTANVLLVTLHHIIADGWSLGIFWRELSHLYNAFCEGRTPQLPPLEIQYADFAHWQRHWFAARLLEVQLQYWRQKLAGAPPLLELPVDYPRPTVPAFRGSAQIFEFDTTLYPQLAALSRRAGATLFMTLLAAFQVLLYRYSGQTDILVGTPIASRNRKDIEPLIGFFANTLVLRSDLSENPSFEALLARVKQTTLEAYTHQDLPFEKLVEELQPERHLNLHPIVQVRFALQNAADSAALELTGLAVRDMGSVAETTREFDLEFHLHSRSQVLVGACAYNTDLFKAETIQRMWEHFQTLLQGIVADSSRAIAEIPLPTAADRQQMLRWSQPQLPEPLWEVPSVLKLLEERSQQHADAIALEFQDERLSYRSLHERANQLARYLQTFGVGPDVIVGVFVERSPDLAIIFLAILKAGGAYLPLDPTYPSERLAYTLADAGVSVLITQPALLESLPIHQARTIALESNAAEVAAQPATPPTVTVSPDALAYLIYTSGSTGRPKGVMVTHRGMGNLAVHLISTFAMTSESRVLQFSSASFDASIMEMVMALGAGACLCFGSRESLLPGPNLVRFLKERAISHALLPPSALAVLQAAALPDLEVLIVGGEACPVPLMRQWAQGRRFFNAYGPTEATVCATIAPCDPEDDAITIGRPIANTEVYILDGCGRSVPIGVPGELHIGGIGLARGYLNHPDLTQEKFIEIPHPLQASNGTPSPKRLYKTGDRARFRADGNIEFLGRLDDRVKLRGFRIELGEIGTTLERHPQVRAAIALLREDLPGDKQLVAYAVLRDESSPDEALRDRPSQDTELPRSSTALREFLREQLPNYMVPSAVIVLEEFPLTPNGKLDRRALPPPTLARDAGQQHPKTEVEQQIAAIWQQFLSVEEVGLDDNFFELGGHSLLLARLQERLQECFGVELPVVELFARPTVGTLAQFFSTASTAARPLDSPEEIENRQSQPSEANQRQQQLRRRDRSGGSQ